MRYTVIVLTLLFDLQLVFKRGSNTEPSEQICLWDTLYTLFGKGATKK